MALKHKLIEFLENNRGNYLSGEQIANELGVTRAAVWKNIKALKEDGYIIEAVTNKGYMLNTEDDSVSAMGIYKYLKNNSLRIEVYDETDSTNKLISLRSDEDEGLIVVAKEQSAGKARQGKRFFSPKDTGIYFSLLLKPNFNEKEAFIVTIMAGVAVCMAIKKVCGIIPSIKGVNDICINDKKICGILTQASFSLEEARTEHIVIGIGLNMYPPENGFPEDISSMVGALYNEKQGNIKNKLVAQIIDDLWDMYNELARNGKYYKDKIIEDYKQYNNNSEVIINLS